MAGNAFGAPALEVTAGGLVVRAEGDVLVAVTGAPCPGAPQNASAWLSAGGELRLGTPERGLRSYVAVRGGPHVAPVWVVLCFLFMAGPSLRGISVSVQYLSPVLNPQNHSAAYGLVSYQTAWLKAHYPAPFMAAVLSADMHNTDKVVTLIEECRSMKLRIVAPDVNNSEFKFTVDDDGRIVYGLGAIKGVGEGPVEAIVECRSEGGPFKDLFDFCARVELRKINKRTLEALIRGGALDRLGPYFSDEPKAYQAGIDRNRAVLAKEWFDLPVNFGGSDRATASESSVCTSRRL